MKKITLLFAFLSINQLLLSQVQNLGTHGSYRLDFPTADGNYPVMSTVFWANGSEIRTPDLSDNYSGKPVPTSDWWTSVVKSGHNTTNSSNLFAHPLSFKTSTSGLLIDYPGAISGTRSAHASHITDFTVGIENLNNPECKVLDYDDWTATIEMGSGTTKLYATIGHGMPFAYFKKEGTGDALISASSTITEIANQNEVLVFSCSGNKYAAFAPSGSSWTRDSNNQYSSSLNGSDYFSIALLPAVDTETTTTYPNSVLEEFRVRAYAFPTNTTHSYNYNESNAQLTNTFTISTTLKENTAGLINSTFLAQYPHQWAYSTDVNTSYTYKSSRGEMKLIKGNSFNTAYTFQGVIPSLPNLIAHSESFNAEYFNNFFEDASNTNLPMTESYNQGKFFNKFIPIVHIADQLGETEVRDDALAKIKTAIEEWFTTDASETDHLFYYDPVWNTISGFPEAHYQASLINDKHFHWGYFVQAAACIAQYDKSWVDKYGPMVELLIKDAANWDRTDTRFPYLRNMDPYAGHCWAGGAGESGNGNNMESSSESMNFNTGVILWGSVTGNTEIRDLGIFLYTSEVAAIEEYWWDINDRTFPSNWGYKTASRVFSNGIDLLTFWTVDYPDCYAINMLPLQGGSTYLGYHPEYVNENFNDFITNIGETAPQSWEDIFWGYLSFNDPELAIEQFHENPVYGEEFGETYLHTYHWMHNMNALGKVDTSVTSDYHLANVFDKEGVKTYVIQNYKDTPITVNFTDGFSTEVPANTLWTNKETIEVNPVEETLTIINAVGNGTEQGNAAISDANLYDDDDTTRWAAFGDDGSKYLTLELDCAHEIDKVKILFYNSLVRSSSFQISTSYDGINYTDATDVLESFKANRAQSFDLPNKPLAKFIRITAYGNSVNGWNSYYEIDVFGNAECGTSNTLSNNKIINQEPIAIAPNPTTSSVEITNQENANLFIYDITGKLLDNTFISSNKFLFDLSTYPNGMYLFKLVSNKQIKTKIIVKK